jgi:hypothetical protein
VPTIGARKFVVNHTMVNLERMGVRDGEPKIEKTPTAHLSAQVNYIDQPTRTMVRRLNRSVLVNTPAAFARAYVTTSFLERPSANEKSDGAEISLRFPLPRFIIGGLTLEKRVNVSLRYGSADAAGRALTISWRPIGSSALPDFHGKLVATPETETACRLAIAGAYTPPGGIAGVAFDQLIGGRISAATIGSLLDQFKASIEADYATRLAP